MNTKFILVSVLFLLIIISCGKGDKTYTIEIKDGVRYVHNHAPLWGDTLKVELEFVQKIGDLETEDENYQLYNPTDVDKDKNGNIYVLDQGNSRIQVFNKNGEYIKTIGRSGMGPAEFILPTCIKIKSKSEIYVGDIGRRDIQVVTFDSKYIKRIPWKYGDFNILKESGEFVAIFRENKQSSQPAVLMKCDSNGVYKTSFGEIVDFKDPRLNFEGNLCTVVIDSEDKILMSYSYQNRIEKYTSDGYLVFRMMRRLDYAVNDKPEFKSYQIDIGGEIIQGEKSNLVKISRDIGTDGNNRIWVFTLKEHFAKELEVKDTNLDQWQFEVFSNDGILLTKLPVDKYFTEMKLFGDNIYLLDSNKEMCVYEYKIVEK